MSPSAKKPPALFRLANLADFLNERIIRTPYIKSTVYFIIALAIFLLFYLFITHLPRTS